MGRRTNVEAADGKQELFITREFDLPAELVFRAHSEPDLVEQWMGTTVLAFEARKHGHWRIETKDPQGTVAFRASGVFHEYIPDRAITRTFEMEGASFGVQLEFLEFKPLSAETSLLTIHSIFRSVEHRNRLLQLPFAQGLSMAHDRLQNIVNKWKGHS